MTSLFETYEAEWHGLTDDLYGNVAKIPTLSGPERAAHLQTVQEKLQVSRAYVRFAVHRSV